MLTEQVNRNMSGYYDNNKQNENDTCSIPIYKYYLQNH